MKIRYRWRDIAACVVVCACAFALPFILASAITRF